MYKDSAKSAKMSVLQQIMDLMDQNETNGLKSRSPKFMAIKVEESPADMSGVDIAPQDGADKEEAMESASEKAAEMAKPGMEDDEDLQKLMELRAKLR